MISLRIPNPVKFIRRFVLTSNKNDCNSFLVAETLIRSYSAATKRLFKRFSAQEIRIGREKEREKREWKTLKPN